ncbi:hypothetical protein ETD83_40890 [Actinomadura soli]|uniref:Uncharacterized protein n=1 Tax=Actinomadura soli TaxID=2508997 RepID=A0A5C4J1I4_9ACTN|nr:hypothetical protein [Actinomadura soli]TMQ84369.1 hypothetical protein ETD83_40890 [Actinomadura soli]
MAIGPQRLSNILTEAAKNNSLAIVTSGALASIFVSHEVVARIYSIFDESAPKVRSKIFAFDANYAYIGWFERGLVFTFVVSGQAAAAALAITAKSFARHKQFDEDPKFGERFIIGTFVSVFFAVIWAVLVRMALNLKPM